MSNSSTGRPSILANLILLTLVGGMVVGFFSLLRSCEEKAGNARVAPYMEEVKQETKPQERANADAIAKSVAEVDGVEVVPSVNRIEGEGVPVVVEGATAEVEAAVGMAVKAELVVDDVLPPKEPVREVAASSAEGGALLKDASDRVDEVPANLYSDEARAKVREGLSKARRIFKVQTIYFEKGGAKVVVEEDAGLRKAVADEQLVEVLDEPSAVFFVLGYADRDGDAVESKKLSKDRAEAVIKVLKKAGVLNLMYPVAIAPTELVAPENQNKNRAVEVWLVLP